MNIGMLWFDNDSKADIGAKIQRAAEYYKRKYGRDPNLCFVHPSMVATSDERMNGVELRTSQSVLPNHFWLGVSAISV